MPDARSLHAILHKLPEVDIGFLAARSLVTGAAGAEDLFHGLRQTIGIAEHHAIKLVSLRFREVPPQQRLEMKADGRDWSLQLMSNGIDEAVVLLAAAQLAHQETGVDNHSGNNEGKEDDTEKQQNTQAPVEDDPSRTERDGQRHQAYAQANEKDDGSTPAGDPHTQPDFTAAVAADDRASTPITTNSSRCTKCLFFARMSAFSTLGCCKISISTSRGIHTFMAYVIAEPCINTKDTACVDACPVDCIHPKKDDPKYATEPLLYIDPVECIDCGACVPVCPVSAIFALDDLPEKWNEFTAKNAAYFGR
jgi:NAD-dependent dihydropyrimidine dehydrogenase PreA subunit